MATPYSEPARTGSRQLSDAVRDGLTAHLVSTAASTRIGALLGVAALAGLSQAGVVARLVWSGLALLGLVVESIAFRLSRPVGRGPWIVVAYLANGAAWGSSGWMLFDGGGISDSVAAPLAVLCAVVTVNASETAGSRVAFVCFSSLAMGLPALRIAVDGSTHSWLFAGAIVGYVGALHLIHGQVRGALIAALVAQEERSRALDELTQAHAVVLEQRDFDALCGVASREHVLRVIRARWDRDRATLGVAALDLDGFKNINDSLGHEAGDRVLVEVASRLQEMAGSGDLIGRLGGDEFVIVLDVDDVESSVARLRGMVQAVGQPMHLPGRVMSSTVSCGFVVATGTAATPVHSAAELLAAADTALYDAKRSGGNRVVSLHDDAVEASVGALRRALWLGEIIAHYQPVFDRANRVVGVECLARWSKPDGSIVPAAEFIPMAMQYGLDQQVSRAVGVDAMMRRNSLNSTPELRWWFNLHPDHLANSDLTGRLEAFLARHQLDPRWFGIEITEHAAHADPAATRRTVQTLHEWGVGIAIDDLGSGFSSLAMLSDMPVDVLKLDRRFVMAIEHSVTDRAVVRSLVGLADDLGIKMTAEGVETRSQHELLLDLGVHQFQGYLLARPEPFDRFAARLSAAGPEARRRAEAAG